MNSPLWVGFFGCLGMVVGVLVSLFSFGVGGYQYGFLLQGVFVVSVLIASVIVYRRISKEIGDGRNID